MTRYLQNEADAARSLTWRRRSHRQGTTTRAGLLSAVGTAPFGANDTTRAGSGSNTAPRPGTTRTKPVGTPTAPVTVKLVERIPSGTDPLRDLAIVNILTRVGVKPSGPKTVMLVGDLANGIAEGSIRLDHGYPPSRHGTPGWEAPHFIGTMRRYLIERISGARGAEADGFGARPHELVCHMAQALCVPNTDSDNKRYIDAIWTPGHDAVLGGRPSARMLTRRRDALRRREAEEDAMVLARRREDRGASVPPRTSGSRTES